MRAELSQALGAILERHEVAKIEVAIATGASEKIVSRWCSVHHDETLSLVDVVGTGLSYPTPAREALEWAASQLGLRIVVARDATQADSLFAGLSDVEDATHAVKRELIDALSPHGDEGSDLTTGELERIRERAAQARAVLESIELAADAALSDRPSPKPRVIDGGRR